MWRAMRRQERRWRETRCGEEPAPPRIPAWAPSSVCFQDPPLDPRMPRLPWNCGGTGCCCQKYSSSFLLSTLSSSTLELVLQRFSAVSSPVCPQRWFPLPLPVSPALKALLLNLQSDSSLNHHQYLKIMLLFLKVFFFFSTQLFLNSIAFFLLYLLQLPQG